MITCFRLRFAAGHENDVEICVARVDCLTLYLAAAVNVTELHGEASRRRDVVQNEFFDNRRAREKETQCFADASGGSDNHHIQRAVVGAHYWWSRVI